MARQELGPLGDLSLADITELTDMAGQAWPKGPGVEVRYVIEARRPGKDWTVMWSALSDEDSEAGVSEDYAQVAFDGMRHASLEFRLVRRTVLASDEVLSPTLGEGE